LRLVGDRELVAGVMAVGRDKVPVLQKGDRKGAHGIFKWIGKEPCQVHGLV